MEPYETLDKLLYECNELFCIHCGTKIEPTYATIHKGECYCNKCQNWMILFNCRNKINVKIFYDEKKMIDIDQFHKYSLTSIHLIFETLIIPLSEIKEIRKSNQIIYKKKEGI
jgi:recombinational DNA repair protein (RecF pathway)